jgi:ketosteroid isomerase-like protein
MSSIKWIFGLLIVVALVIAVMSMGTQPEADETPADARPEAAEMPAASDADPGDLIKADRAFAEETKERGGDGWADFFTRDGIMFPPKGRVDGREDIREIMVPAFGPDQPRLTWEPISATIAASGEIGYTIGSWESIGTSVSGEDSVLATGNYVTIWEKDPDEGWRVAVDIGNRNE